MNNFTVVVPFFNGHKTIQRLLDSLPDNLPVIVVDDHSDSDSATVVFSTDCPVRNIQVIRPEKKGYFTGAVNRGIEACATDVLILNQDTWLEGDAWLNLIADKRGYYGLFGENIKGNHPAYSHGYVQGTFMYIGRDVIENAGLLNEEMYPLWGSTCEYQLRTARKGYRVLPIDEIPGFHHRDPLTISGHGKPQKFGDAINTVLEREPSRRREFIRTPPEISVVIPCYNYGRYLNDAVWSVLLSTFQSTEIIIVDDKSTDDSLKIARAIAKNPYLGVRVIALPANLGTAGAQNAGVEAAHGRYIALLSADDMMKPDRLEKFYRLQQENPHSFIYDDLVLFGSEVEKLRGRVKRGDETIFPLPEYNFENLIHKNGVHGGIFYPRQAWEEAGGYPELMARGREDWAFNVALGLKGWCGVKAPEPGYLYRRDGQNRTNRNTSPEWRQKFVSQMLTLYPDVYRGVRPMGCCGSGSKIQAAKLNGGGGGATMQAQLLPGRDGMEILEYVGTSAGDMTWWGPVSQTRYIFGGNRRVGYVDKRDVEKMVALVDQGAKVFRVYQKPVEKPKAEVVEIREEVPGFEPVILEESWTEFKDLAPMVTTAKTINDPVEAAMVIGVAATRPPFDPAGFSVNALKGRLNNLNEAQLAALLEAEKTGLNRKGAINAIEEVLNA